MVQGQVFLKGEGGAGTFSIYFVQSLSFLHLEITLLFAFEEKIFLLCHHNFIKKSYSKLSKYEPENIP